MKQRFNALDIRATVINLRARLIGVRLQNIYDVNAKTFLFKFAKPDDKELVLIESGTRIHTTQFSREKSSMPSMFCAKLRKHLRTRRLTNVRQLGVDRIVDFEFAGGEKTMGYHVIAEFYASGNIILTDQDYRILALLRVVQGNENIKMAVGEIYSTQSVLREFSKVEMHHLQSALAKAGPKDTLKKVLNIAFDYGPAMIEHIILEANLNPNMKVATEFDTSDNSPMLQALKDAFDKGDQMVEATGSAVPKGYIVLFGDKKEPVEGEEEAMEIYDEFHPYLYKQHASRAYKEFPTFDAAVDQFFSAIEAQKLELKARQQEEAALKKLESVRKEQESRVEGLLQQQMTNTRKAQLIELNLPMVDAAITIIRNAVASQMDWKDLEGLVKNEKKHGNPIALIIDSLKLKTNQITLMLTDPEALEDEESDEDESDEEEDDDDGDTSRSTKKEPEVYLVDVELSLTAFANARKYYEQKKTTASKHDKTIAASSKALKSAERKIRQDLKETKITASINKIRKPFWFEKFLWFISTEGHLVIAGRDMQQNEIIVKRYLAKDDVYVHADLHGAASVVVKNKPQAVGQPIPPSTLFQAGVMSVCQSKAWDAKIVTSAYWVYPDQVSKSAPTGEYLTTGSFMIRGKKNFLPPVQLVYGFGYLFKLDESSVGNHISEQKRLEQSDSPANEPVTSSSPSAVESESGMATPGSVTEETTTSPSESSPGTPLPEESKPVADDASGERAKSVGAADEHDTESSEESDSSDDENAFPDTQLASGLPQSTTETPEAASEAWNKYDLEEYGEDKSLPAFAQPQPSSTASPNKRFMSAKERRQLKKGQKPTDGSPDTGSSKPEQQKTTTNNKPKDKTTKQAPPPPTRGRRSKAKKIKEKYADQDEEERQLRMEILGSNKGPQPKGKKAKKEAKAKAEAERLAKTKKEQEQKAQDEREREKATGEQAVDTDQPQNPEAVGEEKDTEMIRQLLKEENITMLEADEIANLSVLDSLTANPLPEDIIHFAIPVCAPYQALQKYKYKVKLTPGSLKRGKAIKQAQSVFMNAQEATNREKELMKGVPDMEAINTMMSKVKVSAPNLEMNKRKKGKK
ncbi:fibronectin-binding protein A N-terminus-domain-containing protein [Radiomyces spectabilis]|uniref:fibronectin-binding protein A N-terminus-domain-containing protein n=1 Tax=Radiomyces spectabilis TaxID=64574 RepID=UPI00221F86D0|nr:fibronectin-binding protein A N-terminus-domain-containing protein [Radiomyces spectabilis]KAI8394072.1 fibronectin-binding protein A N-terminus-domain-containing protein [Radiomyces spectabilis]